MTTSISIITASGAVQCPTTVGKHKIALDLTAVNQMSFDIEICFQSAIAELRSCDYRWARLDKLRIANSFCTKAIRLENGQLVQPNINAGIWEVSPKNPTRLLWRFNPDDSAPLTMYTSLKNDKMVVAAENSDHPKNLELLFPSHHAIEFSRSALAFSAIACFTDHCDFDTAQSLELQRKLFKDCGIKTTKGFFLNHFSKRPDNASFERNENEFRKWRQDGHELAYHSLSQSIKSDEESFADFRNFNPQFPIPTWIDHGYQPYNLSLYKNSGISQADYADRLQSKKIATLWNYIDSGTATDGVINQLNPDDFTLARFRNGNKNLGFKQQMSLLVKNIMFHYYADQKIIASYKSTAREAKEVIYKRKLNKIIPTINFAMGMARPILEVLTFWNKHKNKPYRYAKYSPLVFRHAIAGRRFNIFQTIEMIDFKKSLRVENIEKLINESGVFIAHTYFSAPMQYHVGRMFLTPDAIDPEVERNFKNLGRQIAAGLVWNPTLNELVEFLAKFEAVRLDVDADGRIFAVDAQDVPQRTIT